MACRCRLPEEDYAAPIQFSSTPQRDEAMPLGFTLEIAFRGHFASYTSAVSFLPLVPELATT